MRGSTLACTLALLLGCGDGATVTDSTAIGDGGPGGDLPGGVPDLTPTPPDAAVVPDGGPAPDGASPPDATGAPMCSSAIGLTSPIPTCSPTSPCAGKNMAVITSATEVPSCATTEKDRPAFDDKAPRTWTGIDGTKRYACVATPSGATATSQRPLVLFFHGAGGSPTNVYNATSLRSKAEKTSFYAGGAQAGFILAAVQGRNLHFPYGGGNDGPHHDIFHRSLTSPSTNPDIASADQLIDDLVLEGKVDKKRIYVMGWSNGGFFAQEYAIARHATATPGGNKVAAAAVFTAADPFNNTEETTSPSCQLSPYPASTVPIFIAGRSCDIIPCDEAQAKDLATEGVRTASTPGYVVSTWVAKLTSSTGVGSVGSKRLIVDPDGNATASCMGPVLCFAARALIQHMSWPDGVADGSKKDHEPEMLAFLAANPLP